MIEDLGSGALLDLQRYGLPKEPIVSERIASGVDIVTFSGDKLLGGPQAGLIVGRRPLVAAIASNPLHRALRCSKLILAALSATLKLYQQAPDITSRVPALRISTRSVAELEGIGREVLLLLHGVLDPTFTLALEDSTCQVGSGTLPMGDIATKVIAIEQIGTNAAVISARFRSARPPILGRVCDGRFLLDLRSVFDPHDLVPRWDD